MKVQLTNLGGVILVAGFVSLLVQKYGNSCFFQTLLRQTDVRLLFLLCQGLFCQVGFDSIENQFVHISWPFHDNHRLF